MSNITVCESLESDWSLKDILEIVITSVSLLLNVFQSLAIHDIKSFDLKCNDCCEIIVHTEESE